MVPRWNKEPHVYVRVYVLKHWEFGSFVVFSCVWNRQMCVWMKSSKGPSNNTNKNKQERKAAVKRRLTQERDE